MRFIRFLHLEPIPSAAVKYWDLANFRLMLPTRSQYIWVELTQRTAKKVSKNLENWAREVISCVIWMKLSQFIWYVNKIVKSTLKLKVGFITSRCEKNHWPRRVFEFSKNTHFWPFYGRYRLFDVVVDVNLMSKINFDVETRLFRMKVWKKSLTMQIFLIFEGNAFLAVL